MQDIQNGISAAELEGAIWRKSQRSTSQGACVELARLDAATVAMRNSRDPQGTALIYPASAVRAMVSALRAGEFDHLVGESLPLTGAKARGRPGRPFLDWTGPGKPASGRARVIAAPRARPHAVFPPGG